MTLDLSPSLNIMPFIARERTTFVTTWPYPVTGRRALVMKRRGLTKILLNRRFDASFPAKAGRKSQ
ncbi:MAG: hypothetical protein JOZ52_11850 [Acidobacteria bacterium]|nr:hypothetical protein [Acidobacteriota bacterium]